MVEDFDLYDCENIVFRIDRDPKPDTIVGSLRNGFLTIDDDDDDDDDDECIVDRDMNEK